jgi:pyrroline-5-carboxylate reductase
MQTQKWTDQLKNLSKKTVAVIGAGKMGGALIDSLISSASIPVEQLRITVKHRERAHALAEKLKLTVATDNAAAVRGADLVLICVKPQHVEDVVAEVAPELREGALVISIATAVTTSEIESAIATPIAVVRAMPNTPCRIGQGMTALCRGRFANDESIAEASALFSLMGKTTEVDEAWMNSVTSLSASGPAFIYVIIEAMAEGGVRTGLPRELATLLAAQATLGAAAMVLESGLHPALLKSEVTTPAGCTVDGLLELEDGKIRASLIRAVTTTSEKAGRLVPHDKARGQSVR